MHVILSVGGCQGSAKLILLTTKQNKIEKNNWDNMDKTSQIKQSFFKFEQCNMLSYFITMVYYITTQQDQISIHHIWYFDM